MNKEGLSIVLSAPSGTGKTTVCFSLKKRYPDLKFSISYTTRLPRDKERDGVDYNYISKDAFQKMLDNGEFLESTEIHDNRYGTSIKKLDETKKKGHDILLELDVQGVETLTASLRRPPSQSRVGPCNGIERAPLTKPGRRAHGSSISRSKMSRRSRRASREERTTAKVGSGCPWKTCWPPTLTSIGFVTSIIEGFRRMVNVEAEAPWMSRSIVLPSRTAVTRIRSCALLPSS